VNQLYRIDPSFILPFLISAISGRNRSFQIDAVQLSSGMGVPLRINGGEFIPRCGPGLVVFNHYSRKGLSILFPVAGLAAIVPVEMHWIMTGAWTFPGNLLRRPLCAISKCVFKRIARIYAFTLTPPMPPEPADAPARTEAVRGVFQHIKANPTTLVALAPEGRDFPGGALGELPPGAGKFMLELNRRLGCIHPIGVYGEDDSLRINFGPPFDLGSIINSYSGNLDEKAGRIVMERIAALLPDRLAGPYKT
jgi:1-acyl-sn-glycerol-3-phosphate acyltransferase